MTIKELLEIDKEDKLKSYLLGNEKRQLLKFIYNTVYEIKDIDEWIERIKQRITKRLVRNSISYLFIEYNIDESISDSLVDEMMTYLNTDFLNNDIIPILNKLLEDKTNKLIDYRQTKELNDEVGTEHELADSFNIDVNQRDNQFLYANQDIYMGNGSDDTHTTLLQKAFDINLEEDRYRELDQINESSDKQLDANTPYAMGHIYQNNAFIEFLNNCTLEEVSNKLKEKGIDKVYDYQKSNNKIKRLAKKIFAIDSKEIIKENLINGKLMPVDMDNMNDYVKKKVKENSIRDNDDLEELTLDMLDILKKGFENSINLDNQKLAYIQYNIQELKDLSKNELKSYIEEEIQEVLNDNNIAKSMLESYLSLLFRNYDLKLFDPVKDFDIYMNDVMKQLETNKNLRTELLKKYIPYKIDNSGCIIYTYDDVKLSDNDLDYIEGFQELIKKEYLNKYIEKYDLNEDEVYDLKEKLDSEYFYDENFYTVIRETIKELNEERLNKVSQEILNNDDDDKITKDEEIPAMKLNFDTAKDYNRSNPVVIARIEDKETGKLKTYVKVGDYGSSHSKTIDLVKDEIGEEEFELALGYLINNIGFVISYSEGGKGFSSIDEVAQIMKEKIPGVEKIYYGDYKKNGNKEETTLYRLAKRCRNWVGEK